MKTLSSYITRDVPLLGVEAWHERGKQYFEKTFAVPFPTRVFLFHDSVCSFYTDKEQFERDMPIRLAKTLTTELLIPIHEQMIEALNSFKTLQIHPEDSAEELLQVLEGILEEFSKGLLGVITTHHLPIAHTRFSKEGISLLDPSIYAMLVEWRKGVGNEYFNEGTECVYRILNALAQKLGWVAKRVNVLLLKELRQCVLEGASITTADISKRLETPFLYAYGSLFFGTACDKELAKQGYALETLELQSGEMLKGITANSGKAKGIARLLFTREQLSHVHEGNIIVAPMTAPWAVPAMRKAAAYVTDEGGITCHAAVMAREFGKPCIIGTKVATKVLKDGDYIEVDADAGRVRKL